MKDKNIKIKKKIKKIPTTFIQSLKNIKIKTFKKVPTTFIQLRIEI